MRITLSYLLQKGGLKLKLIGFTSILIVLTVSILSFFVIQLTKSSIEQKAFEVATTSLKQIANLSTHALLERTRENEINLGEMLHDVKTSKIEGLKDVTIYAHQKTMYGSKYINVAGFSKNSPKEFNESRCLEVFKNIKNDTMFTDESTDFYRFVQPIIYKYQGKPIVLGVAVLKYDKHAINKIVKDVINISIFITTIIIVFIVIVIYFAGTLFTRPILSIADAATDITNGNLDIHLSINTNDEIEELATRFNQMVRGLREREKMEKFVSDSTISMIQENSDKHRILGGEYRNMTFLFSDIRGFTTMSVNKKPDEVVEIINHYLDLQSQIIKCFGGDIDKFIGDEIMASFYGEDGITRALECGTAIQNAIAESNILRRASELTICTVGIGINHGEVVVGNIGSHDRMDFTSIGSEVNLASRLCSIAKSGQIFIEAQTYALANLTHAFAAQVHKINIKGFTEPVDVIVITMEGSTE